MTDATLQSMSLWAILDLLESDCMFKRHDEYSQKTPELEKRIDELNYISQRNINSRLCECYFRYMTAADFEAEQTHSEKQITFVQRNGNIELWKGDIRIILDGGGGGGGTTIEGYMVLFVNYL